MIGRNSDERTLEGESAMISFAKHRLGAAVALGLLGVGLVVGHPLPAHAGNVTLAETGSTLINPLFKVWAADYTKTHAGVTISPAATNSVAGVEQAISGAVQIGASDAYMSDGEVEQNPSIINVPMAQSADSQAQRARSGWNLLGQDSRLGRLGDRDAQSGNKPPAQRHRPNPP
jgi:PBP superfamily domain